MVNWILGDLFTKDFGHHGSTKTLWETRWKFPCSLGVYPFHDSQKHLEDFEPAFQKLIEDKINGPYDDAWTHPFLPTATSLVSQADALASTDKPAAISLYKRANAVFRIARFPYVNGSPLKLDVYERQKKAYLKGAALWDVPLREEVIEHVHKAEGDGGEIPLYVRFPKAEEGKKTPVLLLITGLDGHRPDNSERTDEFLARGWATVICDIPGVADCPALKTDPTSPDRLFTSILDWIAAQPSLDASKVIAWGLSAGGYYAIRLAHTHASKLVGAVGHGAGTHHYIGAEWLAQIDKHEYPFSLKKPYLMKYGYDTWEDLLETCQKRFSLVETGILEMKSCRLLLVNGVLDGCMPVEDSMLLAEYGRPKEMRFVKGRAHMGYPEANSIVFPWLEEVMGE
ncbi:alpha/beta-hydrolase [Aulographum hederae CBS 113979]|uniref:Alpha/beta-hydrolase n=1 Tax=Aulographum hederae CBS 113979 TaxID=1176131 RepID=A0A6G1HGV1_9PEZI|nr:alpha/beta-hydrolase [Aulographum hederae CBS 113979]